MTPDELKALAYQARCTPSLDAAAALDVLADALLEDGQIHDAWKPSKHHHTAKTKARGRLHLLSQAWGWAEAVTCTEFRHRSYLQLKELLDAGVISQRQLVRLFRERRGYWPVEDSDMVDAFAYAMGTGE